MTRNRVERSALLLLAVLMTGVLGAATAHAKGTPAGTDISNQAAASFVIGADTFTANSNVDTFKVDELIHLSVLWQDVAPGVSATPGQAGSITTYRLTNDGNGNESFGLAGTGAGLGNDEFDPTVTAIYLDANGNGSYDAGTDTLYVAGTNDPSLAADGGITIFVLSDMPAAGFSDGDRGNVALTATATTGAIAPGTGVAPGTAFAGMGEGGGDAVVGNSRGTQSATGTHVLAGVVVLVNKAEAVLDPLGGNRPFSGAAIRYTITVTVSGAGTAVGAVFTDRVPQNTTYTPGTLRLNGIVLGDGTSDGDAGDHDVTNPGMVTVALGDLTSASPARVIVFDVRID